MDTNLSSTRADQEAVRSIEEEIAALQAELDDHGEQLRDEIRQYAQTELEILRGRCKALLRLD